MSNFFKKILYYISFGMKGGDDIIISSRNSSMSDEIKINNIVTNENLGEKLLKGEVTQQVEELRYMDYKVYNESKKYKYVGNGDARKIDINERDLTNYSFSQENKLICEGVYDELKRIDNYGVDKHTISIITYDIPRFKLENYCKNVDIKFENGDVTLILHFSKYSDKYDITSRAFINEIKKIINLTNFSQSEFNYLQQLSFVTYKAINEDDLISYNFKQLKLVGIIDSEHEFLFTYKVDYYTRENLLDKFHSHSMQEKYNLSSRKNNNLTYVVGDRIEKCDLCGCDMNKYDSDITKSTYGKSICIKCLEKEIITNNFS